MYRASVPALIFLPRRLAQGEKHRRCEESSPLFGGPVGFAPLHAMGHRNCARIPQSGAHPWRSAPANERCSGADNEEDSIGSAPGEKILGCAGQQTNGRGPTTPSL